jgi:hypothetical protein
LLSGSNQNILKIDFAMFTAALPALFAAVLTDFAAVPMLLLNRLHQLLRVI